MEQRINRVRLRGLENMHSLMKRAVRRALMLNLIAHHAADGRATHHTQRAAAGE